MSFKLKNSIRLNKLNLKPKSIIKMFLNPKLERENRFSKDNIIIDDDSLIGEELPFDF